MLGHTEGPRPWFHMPRAVVIHIHLILLKNVLHINGQQWSQHGHHPRKTDVGQLLVIITASDIGMNPWKPDLYQSLQEVSAKTHHDTNHAVALLYADYPVAPIMPA